ADGDPSHLDRAGVVEVEAGSGDERGELVVVGVRAARGAQHQPGQAEDQDQTDPPHHRLAGRCQRGAAAAGHPVRVTVVLVPQNTWDRNGLATTIAAMDVRIALPTATRTPWGPPVAWKPYQQWISTTSTAKTRAL